VENIPLYGGGEHEKGWKARQKMNELKKKLLYMKMKKIETRNQAA